MADTEPKLQIDDDWKCEAAADKARLAEDAAVEDQQAQMPPAGIPSLVQILAMQAMVGLGGMRGQDGQEVPPNLDHAKHFIDLLGVLDKKTAGNLDEEEAQVLETTLHQLRMAYVESVGQGRPGAS